jgi:hypothetical protein
MSKQHTAPKDGPSTSVPIHFPPGTALPQDRTLLRFWGCNPEPHNTGSCTLSNQTMFLFTDGSITFQAFFQSGNEGDVWLMKKLTFFGSAGDQIGEPVPQHDSLRSLPRGQSQLWIFSTAIPGVSPELAQKIQSFRFDNHC